MGEGKFSSGREINFQNVPGPGADTGIGPITPAQPGACTSVPVQQGPYLSSGLSRADPRRATATLGEGHSGTPLGSWVRKSWPAELWQVGAIGQPVPGVIVPGEEEKV